MWKFPPFSSRLKIGKKTWKFNKMLYRMLCLASGKVKQWFVTLIHGWTSSGICPNVVIGGGQVAGCSLRIQTTSDYRSSIQWVTVGSRIFRLEKAVECGRFLHDSFAYDLAENVSTWRSQCSGLWNGGSLASSFKWSGTSRGQLCRWHASVSRTVPTMGPSSIGFGRLLRQITDSTTNRLRCSISSPQFIHWSFFLKKNNNLMTSVSPESDPPDLPFFGRFFSPKNWSATNLHIGSIWMNLNILKRGVKAAANRLEHVTDVQLSRRWMNQVAAIHWTALHWRTNQKLWWRHMTSRRLCVPRRTPGGLSRSVCDCSVTLLSGWQHVTIIKHFGAHSFGRHLFDLHGTNRTDDASLMRSKWRVYRRISMNQKLLDRPWPTL